MKVMFRISKMGFGGAEQVFISLAKYLTIKHKYEVCFVVDKSQGDNIGEPEKLGCSVISLNVRRNFLSFLPFIKAINTFKPDVIISAYTDTNAVCMMSSLFSQHKAKVILTEHASLYEHWKSKGFFKVLILKFYVKFIYRLASKVVCVSNGLSNQVKELMGYNSDIKTIYNPVRKIECIGFSNKDESVINLLAVGRISKPKDYLTLIKAVAEIKKTHMVNLNIVGGVFDKIEYNNIVLLVNKIGLQNEVNFVGYTEQLGIFYKNADVFVLCSAWEGFGNVLVEALSFGLPIVSTDCNFGPREILENGNYGLLVPVGDFKMLANAIIEQYTNPIHKKSDLINRSESFSEIKIGNEYYDLINEVCYGK
ncbi:glycosyltransferase [Vibrio cholerae]|nr:glycosyltransferase [Vibrio cholerae]GHY15925.1 glycosyltransferase [Vibrio cholerae]